MILIDSVGHMVSNSSLEELHDFAKRISMRREWFQDKNNHPHYDLTTGNAKERALEKGAIMVTSKELVQRMVRQ